MKKNTLRRGRQERVPCIYRGRVLVDPMVSDSSGAPARHAVKSGQKSGSSGVTPFRAGADRTRAEVVGTPYPGYSLPSSGGA